MKKLLHILGLAVAGVLVLGGTSGCSEIAESDKVGLWYAKGEFDGNTFDHCIDPGVSDQVSWNDAVFWVPTNVRTWNADPLGVGDTKEPLVVTAKPEEGQQSGLEINVWTQTNFKLNTFCGEDNRNGASPLVLWWENLGKRYNADTEEGWKNMLYNTVVPALEKAKNVMREYTADESVSGVVWADAEQKFARSFSAELERLSGGDYFCSPTFDRKLRRDCADVQVSIKDVDYRDPGIQAARNDKQKAQEQSQAEIAKAQGQVAAAKAQEELYKNPQWMQLQLEAVRLEQIKACATTQKCIVIMGNGDEAQIHVS